MKRRKKIHTTHGHAHKTLLCHLKLNNHMLTNGLYLLLSLGLGWMKENVQCSQSIVVCFYIGMDEK
jgi:hypothetical protein